MNGKVLSNPVETADFKADILAAFARAESVPCVGTLIDEIPEDDWVNPEVEGWQINAGSANHPDDELDCSDSPIDDSVAA